MWSTKLWSRTASSALCWRLYSASICSSLREGNLCSVQMYTTQEFGTVRWAVSASFSAICVLPDPGSPASSKIPRAPIPPPVSRSKTGTPKLTLRHRSACLVNISLPVSMVGFQSVVFVIKRCCLTTGKAFKF